MVRISMIALLSMVWMTSGGCQSYTTGLQKSAESSNEVAAIAALQFIATAQASYKAAKGDYGTFQQLHDANYLDSRFNSSKPEMAGYAFTMLIQKSEGEPPRFTSNADPVPARTGRHFYIDSTSTLIRVNPSQPATPTDSPIGQ